MKIARLSTLLGLLAVLAAGSLSGASAAVTAPTGLRGFMLTATETSSSTFHRTPSFAWNPMPGAVRYELQISASPTFQDNGILFDSRSYLTPVGAPSITLPWITGSPHSAYSRVRAILGNGQTSPWSSDYGFDVVPPKPPTALPSYDGLLRWTPVEGADRYQVWLPKANQEDSPGRVETVNTNVLDLREFYAFHNDQSWIGDVQWKVRAVRVNALGQLNHMPAATYGKYSDLYDAYNATPVDAPIQLDATVSSTISNGSAGSKAHSLMPAFVWTGDEALDGTPAPFFRVEVFTDSGCLNNVFTSATVASPAYAPRLGGPLSMPTSAIAINDATTKFLPDSALRQGKSTYPEPNDNSADGLPESPTEQAEPAKPTIALGSASGKGLIITGQIGAALDLWDTAWPSSGYYWTVIPVQPQLWGDGSIHYVGMEMPEDACAAGRVQRFGYSSEPSLTADKKPYASGLSATGRLTSATHNTTFYGEPLVAWTPAPNAWTYEVQWSKKSYPFRPVGRRLTFATSYVLPLRPGTWYYRVRGYDYNMPTDAQEMGWSTPARVVVASPWLQITH